MESTPIKELKARYYVNRRLKQMYSELKVDHQLIKNIIEKILVPYHKKELAKVVLAETTVSIGMAFKLIGLQRPLCYYESSKDTHK